MTTGLKLYETLPLKHSHREDVHRGIRLGKMSATPSPDPQLGETRASITPETHDDDRGRCGSGMSQTAAADLALDARRPSTPRPRQSENLELVRRLDRLNGRVLRAVQARVAAMEEALDDLDAQAEAKITAEGEEPDAAVGRRRREDVMDTLLPKLQQYSMLGGTLHVTSHRGRDGLC